MKRKFKNFYKSLLYFTFTTFQKIGINILPNHFYSQIPDVFTLKKEAGWRLPMSMFGINGSDVNTQLEFVKSVRESDVIDDIRNKNIHSDAVLENGEDGGYGEIEAEFLYSFIMKTKPPKIIQIGCGVSTSIIIRAAKNASYKPEIVCIEPYPTHYLIECSNKNDLVLIREKAQNVDIDLLCDLGENCFLFVDSTHTVKPGSEVNKIILEILPRLKKNVWVHFHDIYFPYDYKRDILNGDLFFWLESTLLYAFLINNLQYSIKVSQSMLHYSFPEELKKVFSMYKPQINANGLKIDKNPGIHFPSALYLQSN